MVRLKKETKHYTNIQPMWFDHMSWYGYRSKRYGNMSTISLEISRPFYRPPYDGRAILKSKTLIV